MTTGTHLSEWGGLPTHRFPVLDQYTDEADRDTAMRALPAADTVAWRITVDCDEAEETWTEAFERFLDAVDPGKVEALVIGCWPEAFDSGPDEIFAAIAAARSRLTALRALFVGDITSEECEISWINQGDVTTLLDAFPALEQFGVRGGQNLTFPAVRHENLRALAIQAGGLPAEVVRGVAASEFPALRDLELWLGTSDYGGDCESDDLAPILAGDRLPALTRLALRNSEMQDAVCAAVASAPVVAQLHELDLSMGVLTDDGVVALLGGQPLTHLKSLDLHHNYVSTEIGARLVDTLTTGGVTLNIDSDDADSYEDGDTVWRYISVAE
ncbi:STM4015 family protein [Nocardia sp. AG03]|uniref:STM4015 family protein n=1 Tax=Nocardia sp. AG03 TaxID=3025312 RepID=UPI0024184030|nr:STM4015 family protein [Nocardia sp. AG03]